MLAEQYDAGRITLTELNNGKAVLNYALSRQKEAANIVAKSNADLLYEIGVDPLTGTTIHFEDNIDNLFSRFNVPETHSSTSLTLQKLEQERNLAKQHISVTATIISLFTNLLLISILKRSATHLFLQVTVTCHKSTLCQ